MCNLSQGIIDRAIVIATDKDTVDNLISLMETMNVSEEKTMDALKVLPQYRTVYHDMIAERQKLQLV